MTKLIEARRRLRRFQLTYGPSITPRMSVAFANDWARALAIDPEGSQCLRLVEDFEERITPMKS